MNPMQSQTQASNQANIAEQIVDEEILHGDFLISPALCKDILTLNFNLSNEHRLRRWSSYGLSADFLGDYFSAFFPGTCLDGAPISQRQEAKASVSFIANELIENAVKYGDRTDAFPITITLRLDGNTILFEASNPASPEHVQRYQSFVTRLLEGDPSELYFQQLEHTARGSGQSQMGILTIIHDYGARFGWRFRPAVTTDSPWLVSVMVHLTLGCDDDAG